MQPTPFSSSEVYAKHRNPEEIHNMERRNQEAERRAYQYGDPVNQAPEPMPWEVDVKTTQRYRRPRLASLVLRFVTFFFS